MQEEILNAVEKLRQLSPTERAEALSGYRPERARLIFEQLEAPLQQEMLEYLPSRDVDRLVEDLDPDDRVRLLDALPEAVARSLLAHLNRREWRLTHKLLAFPAESAGRIMSPEYLPLAPAQAARDALALIHREGRNAATVNTLPVVDAGNRVLGLVTLSQLVLADPAQRVSTLMTEDVPTVDPATDQEEVARLIQAADLLALPVVDESGALLGLITVDDAMDVIQLEEGEDFARTGASEPLDRPYLSMSLLGLTRARLVWLLLLAVAGTLTVNVLEAFESHLERVISLSLFIPLLIGVGGNSGAQSATTVIRAMATGDVGAAGTLRVIVREACVGLLLGAGLGAISYLPVFVLFDAALALTVSLTLVTICTFATLVGSGMPLVARRLHIDPAVVSAPVVTTLVDAGGLLVYFIIAGAVMGL